ncbi:hypothetical protein VP01_2883g1 [Puccinia sorghi]|uniref:HAT C-terminal dimerisation domain-containing protein n=1 Tax=Puccinia sorghi TaxID=27349 RepID=A0A0L6V2F3_9BASI|nr:hypothetical protein VP01_2883g1 [Puccinia sorghi]
MNIRKNQIVEAFRDEANQYIVDSNNSIQSKQINQANPILKPNSSQYPTPANISRIYLAVPASSVPCKQFFLAGIYILTYTCNHLIIENLESLICKKDWIRHYIVDINSIN